MELFGTIGFFSLLASHFSLVISLNPGVLAENQKRTENEADNSSEVAKRVFESWLKKTGKINESSELTDFVGHDSFHPLESAHFYQGDIRGYGGHMIYYKDGRKNFEITQWQGGQIPYTLSGFSKYETRVIQDVIREFEDKTCLKFVKRSDQKEYVKIEPWSKGCWSYVGRIQRQPQTLNLGKGCINRATVIHELMHVIGFIHEQSRPDRDNYVKIFWDNIRKGESHNFQIDRYAYQDLGVSYDTENRTKPTMIARNGKKLGNKEGFSPSDILEINRFYNCEDNDII